MQLRSALLVLCAAVSLAVPVAQTRDPVSGTWGSDGVTFLELKFDGKRSVSGTAIWRGGGRELRTPIDRGSFDPATGALRLEGDGESPDGRKGRYLIEGTVKGDTVSGTFAQLDRKGDFSFTRLPDADRVSGEWSGEMTHENGDSMPVTATLKFDGKTITGLITGPPFPGDIIAGAFDSSTSALRFDVVVRNDDKTPVVFEGTLADGVAKGRVKLPQASGTFTLKKKAGGR